MIAFCSSWVDGSRIELMSFILRGMLRVLFLFLLAILIGDLKTQRQPWPRRQSNSNTPILKINHTPPSQAHASSS